MMIMITMMIMTCYISGDYLSFQGDSQKPRAVAMVTSPWQPKTANSPLHCFKFRYLVYGPEAHHLEVFIKYRGEDSESRIWAASQDGTDVWGYGQVPVGALCEFQVNRSQRKSKQFDRKQFLSNGRLRNSATSNGNVCAPIWPGHDFRSIKMTCWLMFMAGKVHFQRLKYNAYPLKVSNDIWVITQPQTSSSFQSFSVNEGVPLRDVTTRCHPVKRMESDSICNRPVMTC